jgi:hypothetical protein
LKYRTALQTSNKKLQTNKNAAAVAVIHWTAAAFFIKAAQMA